MYLDYLIQKAKKMLVSNTKRKDALVIGWRRRVPVPAPHVPSPSPSVPPAGIEHVLNDPTTPDLVKTTTEPPSVPQSPYVVKGYKGGGYNRGSVEYQAANVYVTIGETINSISEVKIPHWHRTNQLSVFPRAGVDLNAFYDGRSLQFFYASNPRIGTVFASDAADITSHECGHGILDCYRPDLWNAAFLEVGAFHECFGDFCALMHAIHHDEMVNKALIETGGDLSQSNVISRLAEQFGRAIYQLDPTGRNPDYLRNAVNNYNYVDPSTLPSDTTDDKLAAEVHSFSRIFTGAIYDIFFMIFKDIKDSGVAPAIAAKNAGNIVCHYVIKSVINAPLNAKFFASMAKTMLWADVTIANRKYHDRMHEIFMKRNIINAEFMAMSAPKCTDNRNIMKKTGSMNLKLADVTLRTLGTDSNPLYNVEVNIPTEEAHLYDNNGNCIGHVAIAEEESIKGAQDFIEHLHRTRGVGPDSSTPWEIRNGKLTRTRTCCF